MQIFGRACLKMKLQLPPNAWIFDATSLAILKMSASLLIMAAALSEISTVLLAISMALLATSACFKKAKFKKYDSTTALQVSETNVML